MQSIQDLENYVRAHNPIFKNGNTDYYNFCNVYAFEIHGGKRTYDSLEPDVNEQREYVCLICDTSYPSLYMKYRHQQERGHLMDRGRPVRQLNLVQE